MNAPTPTTLIDRVDEHDRPVGRVPRDEALRTGSNFRTAHVFLLDGSNRLLLQRLAAERPRHAGRWGSSVAAYLHSGESYEDAANRRLFEELGVRTSLARLVKIRIRDEGATKFVTLFVGRDGPALVREPEHIAEIRYWPLPILDTETRVAAELFTPTFLELYDAFRASAR